MSMSSDAIRRQYLANKNKEIRRLLQQDDSGIGVPLTSIPFAGDDVSNSQSPGSPGQTLATLRQRIAKHKTGDSHPTVAFLNSSGVPSGSPGVLDGRLSARHQPAVASSLHGHSLSSRAGTSTIVRPTSSPGPATTGPAAEALMRAATPLRSPERPTTTSSSAAAVTADLSTQSGPRTPLQARPGLGARVATPGTVEPWSPPDTALRRAQAETGAGASSGPLDSTAAFFSVSPSPPRQAAPRPQPQGRGDDDEDGRGAGRAGRDSFGITSGTAAGSNTSTDLDSDLAVRQALFTATATLDFNSSGTAAEGGSGGSGGQEESAGATHGPEGPHADLPHAGHAAFEAHNASLHDHSTSGLSLNGTLGGYGALMAISPLKSTQSARDGQRGSPLKSAAGYGASLGSGSGAEFASPSRPRQDVGTAAAAVLSTPRAGAVPPPVASPARPSHATSGVAAGVVGVGSPGRARLAAAGLGAGLGMPTAGRTGEGTDTQPASSSLSLSASASYTSGASMGYNSGLAGLMPTGNGNNGGSGDNGGSGVGAGSRGGPVLGSPGGLSMLMPTGMAERQGPGAGSSPGYGPDSAVKPSMPSVVAVSSSSASQGAGGMDGAAPASALLPPSDALKSFLAQLDDMDSQLDSGRGSGLGLGSVVAAGGGAWPVHSPGRGVASDTAAQALVSGPGTGAVKHSPGVSDVSVSMQRFLADLEDSGAGSGNGSVVMGAGGDAPPRATASPGKAPRPAGPPPARTSGPSMPAPEPDYTSSSSSSAQPGLAAYASIRAKVLSMSLELEEKGRTVGILRSQLGVAKQLLKSREEAADTRIRELLASQKSEFEGVLTRHLTFIDQLLKDKKSLAQQAAKAASDAAEATAAAERRVKAVEGHVAVEMQRAKDAWATAEAARRAEWQTKHAAELKAKTLKGLEPQIQALLDKHKEEVSAIRAAADEQVTEAARVWEGRLAAVVKAAKDEARAEAEAAYEADRTSWKARERAIREEADAALSSARARWTAELEEERKRSSAAARADAERHLEELSRLQGQWQAKLSEVMARHAEERETSLRGIASAVEAERLRCAAERDGERASWEARAMERLRRDMESKDAEIRSEAVRARDEAVRLVIMKLEAELGEDKRRLREGHEATMARVRAEAEARVAELQAELSRLRGAYEEAVKGRDAASSVHGEEAVRLGRALEASQAEVGSLRDRLGTAMADAEAARRDAQTARAAGDRALATARQEADERVSRLTERVNSLTADLDANRSLAEQRQAALRAQADNELREVQARVAAALRKRDAELAELRIAVAEERARAETAQRLLEQRQELDGLGLGLEGGQIQPPSSANGPVGQAAVRASVASGAAPAPTRASVGGGSRVGSQAGTISRAAFGAGRR